jgi:hypothetical protein
MVSWKKGLMLLIETGGSESVGIMDTSRMTKSVIDNDKVVRHNNCLQNYLIVDYEGGGRGGGNTWQPRE